MPNPMPMHMPFHDGGFMQMPRGHQANLHYGHPPAMSPFINSPVGYTPWPNSPAMNYAQSLHGPDTHLFRLLILGFCCCFGQFDYYYFLWLTLLLTLQASFCKQSLTTGSVLSTMSV